MERTVRESILAHYRAINEGLSSRETQEGLSSRETQEGDYDLLYETCCMFINNFFYNLYTNESDQYISNKGSITVSWLIVISIIYTIIESIDHSTQEIIFEIILLCLGIRSLLFTDMFGKRLEDNITEINTRLGSIETRIGGIETRIEGIERIETRIGEIERQIGTMQTMQQQVQTMQQQMQTMQQQMQTMQQQQMQIMQQQQ